METVMIRSGKVVSLLGKPITDSSNAITGYNGVTTTTTGSAHYKDSPWSFFQATVTGTGAVTATVVIEASNDNVNWCATALGTISLSGTTSSSDGFTYVGPAKFIRARVSAISGTGATVVALMGV